MNAKRRSKIKLGIDQLEACAFYLRQIYDEEELSYDNIPENLKDSIRASEIEENLEVFEEALDMIDEAISQLEGVIL